MRLIVANSWEESDGHSSPHLGHKNGGLGAQCTKVSSAMGTKVWATLSSAYFSASASDAADPAANEVY